MKKFGFIVDLSDTAQEKYEQIVDAFDRFSDELSPKHLKNTQLRIILPPGSPYIDQGRVISGPLEQQEFGESPWQTDWLYFLPEFNMKKWLNFSAMAGPGPVLAKEQSAEVPMGLLIPCLSSGDSGFVEAMSECVDAIYHDEGARKIFSKTARKIFKEALQKNITIKAYKVS
ncbi:MAG TPA: hypothetical protein PKN57_06775 [Saprospiraceae bacterium]|nr:hypothetical protein [Saprospiraceae bacterium]MCC6688308.1 hypothetical protein [Saprospiraceae bacterium]HMV23930.1 hypothetical protein [Saprospiraceae bacterium]HMX83902.1 hypothetical protein [Saprospiraceae bacterium]HMZ73294.1 hypothetical protein [Saprospiraceae bacterium]